MQEAPAVAARYAPETASTAQRLLLPAAALAFLGFWWFGRAIAPWAFTYPQGWSVPAGRWIGGAMNWLVKDAALGGLSFTDLTRFAALLIDLPYRAVLARADGIRRRTDWFRHHLGRGLWNACLVGRAVSEFSSRR